MSLSEAKAGLFLAYWMDPGEAQGQEKSNILQQVQVAAAGEMVKKGVIDIAFFDAGQIYQDRRAVSFVMAGEARDQFPDLGAHQIQSDPMGLDTKGEMKKFYAESAVVKLWTPATIVGIKPHCRRIGLINQRIDRCGQPPVPVSSSDSFLRNDPELALKYQELLTQYDNSRELFAFRIHEAVFSTVEQLGLGERLDWLSENLPYKPAIQVAVLSVLSSLRK